MGYRNMDCLMKKAMNGLMREAMDGPMREAMDGLMKEAIVTLLALSLLADILCRGWQLAYPVQPRT